MNLIDRPYQEASGWRNGADAILQEDEILVSCSQTYIYQSRSLCAHGVVANCLIHQDGVHLRVCGASFDDVIPVEANTVVHASWTSTGVDMLLAGILGQVLPPSLPKPFHTRSTKRGSGHHLACDT